MNHLINLKSSVLVDDGDATLVNIFCTECEQDIVINKSYMTVGGELSTVVPILFIPIPIVLETRIPQCRYSQDIILSKKTSFQDRTKLKNFIYNYNLLSRGLALHIVSSFYIKYSIGESSSYTQISAITEYIN